MGHTGQRTGRAVRSEPRDGGGTVRAILTLEEEESSMSERKQAKPGFVVLRHVRGDDWRLLGEVERKRGLPARAARSQAILEATAGAARPGEVFAAVLRSEWRVSLDWEHPSA